ncbi:MAG: bacteriohemerythrin [Formivibrio sp.]|nr:bacteriohemerythrin [Formivibrio sp.]
MAKLQIGWSNDYSLGLDDVDIQHQSLFIIINKTWKAIAEQSDCQQILLLVDELETYTRAHFDAEEAFMRESGFPEIDEHATSHQRFIARITAERVAVLAGRALSLDSTYFLRCWLVDHILVADKSYADFTRRNGMGSVLRRFFRRF